MLKRFYEWYRVVNINPSDDVLEKRRAAVQDLVTRILTAPGDPFCMAIIGIAIHDPEGAFDHNSEHVRALVDIIRTHHLAFPADLSDNALELRTVAAAALGEILSSNASDAPKFAAVIASIVVSSVGNAETTRAKYLEQMLAELYELSRSSLSKLAREARERRSVITSGPEQSAVESATLKSLHAHMNAQFKELERQREADREELNLLWWMYRGYSDELRIKISEAAPSMAGLASAKAIGDLSILPPLLAIEEMTAKMTGVSGPDQPLVKAIEFAQSIHPTGSSLLIPENHSLLQLVEAYPAMMPLTWLLIRLRGGQTEASLRTNLRKKIPWSTKTEMSNENWAIQCLRERIAQRAYEGVEG
jgi:hypothetical protein